MCIVVLRRYTQGPLFIAIGERILHVAIWAIYKGRSACGVVWAPQCPSWNCHATPFKKTTFCADLGTHPYRSISRTLIGRTAGIANNLRHLGKGLP
jgi:hypothetical protein